MASLSNTLPPSAQAAAITGSYLDFDGLSKLKGQARSDAKAATRETAQQFEAMFLQMMMKSMRDATPKSELNTSSATETFEAMFDKEVSVAMSKRNALGLADMLVKHMPDTSSAQPSTAALLAARAGKSKGMTLQPEAVKPMGLEVAATVLAPLPKVGGPISLNSGFAPLREGSKP